MQERLRAGISRREIHLVTYGPKQARREEEGGDLIPIPFHAQLVLACDSEATSISRYAACMNT